MLQFLLKRLAMAIPTLWFIATAVFMLSKLMPGTYGSAHLQQADPGYYSKSDAKARDHSYREFLKATGQDLPLFYFSISSPPLTAPLQHNSSESHAAAPRELPTGYTFLLPAVEWHGTQNQYHQWLSSLATGGLGTSLRDGRPVLSVLVEAVGNTWWLLLASMAVASLVAMELALLMVRRKGRAWRKAVLPLLFVIDSIPLFVLAMLLLVLLANPAFLQLFPVYGMGYYNSSQQTLWQELSQWLQYMALPISTLVLGNLPYLTNQFYQSVVAVAGQEYIRTAYAKGLSESRVIRRHMLRNALLPIITLLSDFLPALVGGAVIIETVFAIPGIGRLLLDAVLSRDYPVIVGIVVVIALFRVLAHLLADMLYTLADPRLKHSSA